MRLASCVGIAALAASLGCSGTTSSPTSGGTVSGPANSSTNGVAASSGAGPGTSGGASTGGSSSGAGSSGTGSGGASGTTGRVPVYVDGGYVSCSGSIAVDGGDEAVTWDCRSGTYFCAVDGGFSCVQCRSDVDCANPDLPTFDPRRPHCDVDSGVVGYQGYCQVCARDSDCNGNPAGPACDPDPTNRRPSIELQGFETCGPRPLGCPYGTRPGLGGCTVKASDCVGDQDCLLAVSSTQLLAPFCAGGACSATPADVSVCPDCYCFEDFGCGSFGGDAGLTCDLTTNTCGCSSSAQCGGDWPICLLPSGGGLGICGCDQDSQCGDGGLRCLLLPPVAPSNGGPTCAMPCDDPRFPACGDWSSHNPICDPLSGLCQPCGSDNDCRTKASGPSVGPDCRLDGLCGCLRDGDCPAGQVCQDFSVRSQGGAEVGSCGLPPERCTQATCTQGNRCDADSGACVPGCLINEDCWGAGYPFCEPDAGSCLGCLTNADCVRTGSANYGSSFCDPTFGQCQYDGCAVDADCAGNVLGPHCVPNPHFAGDLFCGCSGDADCGHDPAGPHCDVNKSDPLFGRCTCVAAADCQPGHGCAASGGPASCGYCYRDSDCAPEFFCNPLYNCVPRCDLGHSCAAPDQICDTDDLSGLNVPAVDGDGGVTWCVGCLTAGDCPAGMGCQTGSPGSISCGACSSSNQCRPGEACALNGECRPTCGVTDCPSGQVCDVDNVVGYGANVCYECLGPSDCSAGQGCNSKTRTCGTCAGTTSQGELNMCEAPFACGDCAPDDVCSNYWTNGSDGVCLQNCDVTRCPAGFACAELPNLTPDHKYCFECLKDSDCASKGPGAWCDVSVNLTFTCQPRPL